MMKQANKKPLKPTSFKLTEAQKKYLGKGLGTKVRELIDKDMREKRTYMEIFEYFKDNHNITLIASEIHDILNFLNI